LRRFGLLTIVCRTVAATAFATSLGIHFGVLPYKYFIFHTFYIFKFPPEPWRFVTSFLITGSGLSLLFDTYFLYQYLSQLEVGNPRFSRKEDLIWYLTFVSGTILVGLSFCLHAHPSLL
jgi:Derlin-2/3